MKKIKILNLYACLGGNRYKWNEIPNLEITAVELDTELAKLYKERFPDDIVIITDAHQYLLEHFQEFDFIWSSPPCVTHSKLNLINKGIGARKNNTTYVDMKLYQEIILLKTYFKGLFCVENVNPFYEPLIQGQKRGRHIFWTNFILPQNLNERKGINIKWTKIKELQKFHNISIQDLKTKRKDQTLRNLVDYEIGLTILKTALKIKDDNNKKQLNLF